MYIQVSDNNLREGKTSFGAKKTTHLEIIKKIGVDNFPNDKILSRFKKEQDVPLYNIHTEFYNDLLECKTLEEAKEKHPEFSSVFGSKDIAVETLDKRSFLYKIWTGVIKGITLDNLSLEILKRYYAKALTIKKPENYFGLTKAIIRKKLLPQLNIETYNSKYSNYLGRSNPEYIEKQIENTNRFYQSEEGQRTLKINRLSNKIAWHLSTAIRNKMSQIAANFPLLHVAIVNKQQENTKGTHCKNYLKDYFRKCAQSDLTGFQKTIGAVTALMYAEITTLSKKIKDGTANENDINIMSEYYKMTQKIASEYLDCFSEIKDKLSINKV